MRYCIMVILGLCVALCTAAQANRIFIDDFEIEPDSVLTVPIMLANETPTRGVQFCLNLPDGLKIAGYNLLDVSLELDMQMSHKQKGNKHTVFLYPMGRVCFPADTTAILAIDVKASHDFKGGVIKLNNCRGATIENKSMTLGDGTTNVSIPPASLMGRPEDATNGLFFSIPDGAVRSDDDASSPD